MTDPLTPDDSQFRSWFRDCLGSLSGTVVEWPLLMRQVLSEELHRLRVSDQYYKGTIFRNRDDKVLKYRARDPRDEEILVYRLYGAVHEKFEGVLMIGETPIWLFSCEVPNQGKTLSNRTKKRRADLLGLRQDGSIVVFECKGPHNRKDSPLYGLLEGLDYLGCLLSHRNLTRLNDDLLDWIVEYEPRELATDQFSSVVPSWSSFAINPQAQHGVIVLAPQEYFDLHVSDGSGQSTDWWLLSNRFASKLCPDSKIDIDFAVVDFEQGQAKWLELPTPSQAMLRPNATQCNLTAVDVLPHDLTWFDGKEHRLVTRVRRGGKNTRIRLSDGTMCVVPNSQLRPAEPQES